MGLQGANMGGEGYVMFENIETNLFIYADIVRFDFKTGLFVEYHAYNCF